MGTSAVKSGVVYFDSAPEKMVEILTEMKLRGRAVAVDVETGELFDIDKGIEFYRSLCAGSQAHSILQKLEVVGDLA